MTWHGTSRDKKSLNHECLILMLFFVQPYMHQRLREGLFQFHMPAKTFMAYLHAKQFAERSDNMLVVKNNNHRSS